MRIGIDARLINESGIGRYIKNLLIELQEIDTNNEYIIFLRGKDLSKYVFKDNFKKIEADFAWYGVAEQIKFPPLIYSQKIDLMHFPHFNIPILFRGKFVVMIHDLIHQHHNMSKSSTHGPLMFAIKKIGYEKAFKFALKRSEKIITPSNYVKTQIINEWNINEEKIIVTYEGVEEELLKKTVNINKSLDKYGVKKPFIFYAGNAHPHKNIDRLITAFIELKKDHPNLQLVLSGKENFFWKRTKEKYNQKDIIYTGFISDEELVAFYKSAETYVFPSLEEGFGIPLLEAMACGCPVVSSNAGSLTEVGGDAAYYFDPKNINDLIEKINQVLSDQNLRKDLIEKGNKRCKQFSWKKMAKETLKIYETS